ncbi:carbohydrate transporter, partial [Salmonella enterica subsp. enterica serovar Typhimurium]
VMLPFDCVRLDNWLQVIQVMKEFNLHALLILVNSMNSDGPDSIPAGEQ